MSTGSTNQKMFTGIFSKNNFLVLQIEEIIDHANFSMVVELWFTDQNLAVGRQTTITCVSTRTLQLQFTCAKGLHYHLPVIFDYFHLGAVTITIHASLIALHQPYIK